MAIQFLTFGLLQLAPSLAAVAARIVALITLIGAGAYFSQALTNRQSSDRAVRLQGTKDAADTIKPVLSNPGLQGALEEAGLSAAAVQSNFQADIDAAAVSELTLDKLPPFTTFNEASDFLLMAGSWYERGLIPYRSYLQIQAYVEGELLRLDLGITPLGIKAIPNIVSLLSNLPTVTALTQVGDLIRSAGEWVSAGYLTMEGLLRLNDWAKREIARIEAAAPAKVYGVAALAPPVVTVPPLVVPTDLTGVIASLQAILNQLAATGQATRAQLDHLSTQISQLSTVAARPFPGTLEIPGVQSAIGALPSILTGAMPLAFAAAISAAMTASAGQVGHNSQTARYNCMGGFFAPLLNVLMKMSPAIVAGGIMAKGSIVRNKVDEIIKDLVDTFLQVERYPMPAVEDTALKAASDRLFEAIGFGLTAQAIAYTAEAITPLKQMGFGQLAGFVGDLAGFKRIADGIMGTVEYAAIYQPLRWKANRAYRPTLPSEGLIQSMFEKYAVTNEEMRDILERLGLPDTVIKRLPSFLFRNPRFGELIRAVQLHPLTLAAEPSMDARETLERAGIAIDADWFIKFKLAKSGLDPFDIETFTPVVKLGALRRELSLRYALVERLFREGYIDETRARQEIEDALKPIGLAEYRLAAFRLMAEYEAKEDTKQLIVSALAKGVLTQGEGFAQFASLGLQPDRIRLQILRAKLNLQPRSVGSVVPPAAAVPGEASFEE